MPDNTKLCVAELMPAGGSNAMETLTDSRLEEVVRQNEALRGLVLALSAEMSQVSIMLREMVTLTASQEASIKRTAIGRAQELCAKYGLPQNRYARIAALIRADVTRPSGVRAVRDIPRCEFDQALEQARAWEKPGVLRKMTRGEENA